MKPAKKLLLTAVIAASAALASQANATLIEDWNFILNSAWTDSSPGAVDGSMQATINPDTPTFGDALLSWGTDILLTTQGIDPGDPPVSDGDPTNDRSHLFIDNPNETGIFDLSGDLTDMQDGTLFFHLNNPITDGGGTTPFLLSAELTDFFQLEDASNPGTPIFTIEPVFDIRYLETNNDGDCENGAGQGDDCNDIFVIMNADDLVVQFVNMGFLYTLEIGAEGLGILSPTVCQFVTGTFEACTGLVTMEGMANPVQFTLTLTAEQISIPTPATLALLGAGLLGLGAFARRQRK